MTNMQTTKLCTCDTVKLCSCGKPALRTSTMDMCKTCEKDYAQMHTHAPGQLSPEDMNTLIEQTL